MIGTLLTLSCKFQRYKKQTVGTLLSEKMNISTSHVSLMYLLS